MKSISLYNDMLSAIDEVFSHKDIIGSLPIDDLVSQVMKLAAVEAWLHTDESYSHQELRVVYVRQHISLNIKEYINESL